MSGIANFPSNNSAMAIAINISASGDNTVISSVTGQIIRVVKLVLAAQSVVAVTLKDGATAKFGPASLAELALDLETNPLVLTSGNAFVINLGAAVQVGGYAMYLQSVSGF